jgi:peptidylprolyl isomerase
VTPIPTGDTDYYALLAVDPGADAVAIRKAWAVQQRLWGVRQNAPDLAARHEAERQVQLLGEVRDVLLDPLRRAAYDQHQAERRASELTLALVRDPRPGSEPSLSRRPSVSGQPGAAPRHRETASAFGVGLTGGLVTGSQVFHWDFPLMVAIVLALSVPVFAFDVFGLRSTTWPFRNWARGFATWLVLLELTLGFGLWALADRDASVAGAAAVVAATSIPRPRAPTAIPPTAIAPAAPTVSKVIATLVPTAAAILVPTAATREIMLPDGLRYTDDRLGTGAVAQVGKTLVVHYTGWLLDGTLFDTTKTRNQPFSFTLGRGEVLKGWDEGVVGMKVGGTRTLIIPGDLGYGVRGALDVIPPNASLRYEVDLLDVR